MALKDLAREAVLRAIGEFDELGRAAFLEKYGFDEARSYFVLHDGKRYDSKAIAGAAHGFIPGHQPLAASEFSGGDRTVKATLTELGFEVESAPRNPTWTRDELILALDLYFRHRPDRISKSHPEVLALSELLNALPLQRDRPDAERFRNPNGVYMKLCNFLRFDPEYSGTGLTGGGQGEEVVWNEFAKDRARLSQVAAAIRSGRTAPEVIASSVDEEDDNDFPEGRILFRRHRVRERSRELREAVKRRALRDGGRLSCAACGFDFGATYGTIGDGFIECHHTTPVSELTGEAKSKVEDIALLCANCHRMVHRRRPWLTMANLKDLLPPGGDGGPTGRPT